MAMGVGGQFDSGHIARSNWTQLAADIDVGRFLVLGTVETMAARVPDVLERELDTLAAGIGQVPRRQQLSRTIKRRVKKAVALLS